MHIINTFSTISLKIDRLPQQKTAGRAVCAANGAPAFD
jgi:hypothetical protein